jgi:hypothetical protein
MHQEAKPIMSKNTGLSIRDMRNRLAMTQEEFARLRRAGFGFTLTVAFGHQVEHRLTLALTQSVVAGVHRHPMQPGRERRVATELRELSQGREKRFLCRVASVFTVAQDPQTDVVDAGLVPLDERRERVAVALQVSPDEFLV